MPIATDPLSLVFIGCFLFGLLFLVVAAVTGHLDHAHAGFGHEIGHANGLHGSADHAQAGHGLEHVEGDEGRGETAALRGANGSNFSLLTYLNPTSVVLFLLGFGFFGYVFHIVTSLMLPATLVAAVAGGLLVAFLLLSLINRLFGDGEGATVQDVTDRVGLLGKVSLTIKPNELGEIIYVSPGGMRKSIPARSVDGRRFERDQEVVVINFERGVADVDTWEHFVDHETATTRSSVTPDSLEQAKLRALFEETDQKNTEIVTPNDVQKE